MFFIKWLYNKLLNFSFSKYISSHPTSICSKLGFVLGTLLLTLSISLNKSLLVEIPGTKHLTYLVIVDFTFKTCACTLYTYITYFWSYSQVLALQAVNGLALKNYNLSFNDQCFHHILQSKSTDWFLYDEITGR